MYEQINANLPKPDMDDDDSEEASDEELLYPWERIDPEHDWFQAAMWQHAEQGLLLAVEKEVGPHDSGERWQVALLRPQDGETANDLVREIETGFEKPATAIHEAKAMMMLNEVLDDGDS